MQEVIGLDEAHTFLVAFYSDIIRLSFAISEMSFNLYHLIALQKRKKLSAKICSAKKVFCSLTFVIQMHLHQAVFQKPNKINPKVTNLSSCDLGHLCCSVLYCWSAVKGKYSGKLTKKYCCIAVYISTYFFKVLHRVWSLGVVGRSRHIFSAVYRAGEG